MWKLVSVYQSFFTLHSTLEKNCFNVVLVQNIKEKIEKNILIPLVINDWELF